VEPFAPLVLQRPVIRLIDQTLLPHEERWRTISTVGELQEAIRALRVRGAPLLGIAGAAGMALAAETGDGGNASLARAAAAIGSTRPTAVELASGAAAALEAALEVADSAARLDCLWAFASRYIARRIEEDLRLARLGAELLPPGAAVLTHCNTGVLATGGIGTALGVIRVAWESGRLSHWYATETRPLLQGARLTAWELRQAGIPSSLLPDTAAASLIAAGNVHAVITGADRIAANGDTANKVGTYGLAAVAARHGVPFYIAAPTSTIDFACFVGASIPIEMRDPAEVGGFAEVRWSPAGVGAYNPAFDVTPAGLIAAIITEAGVAAAPYSVSLPGLRGMP